jgi:hypothetical protein
MQPSEKAPLLENGVEISQTYSKLVFGRRAYILTGHDKEVLLKREIPHLVGLTNCHFRGQGCERNAFWTNAVAIKGVLS